MDTNAGLRSNFLPNMHGDSLRILTDVLDSWGALTEAISPIVVNHHIDAVLNIEIEKIRVVLDLFSVHRVRPAEDHTWVSTCLVGSSIRLRDPCWDPIAMDSLMIVSPQENGLSLWVTELHFSSQLLKRPKDLQLEPPLNLHFHV